MSLAHGKEQYQHFRFSSSRSLASRLQFVSSAWLGKVRLSLSWRSIRVMRFGTVMAIVANAMFWAACGIERERTTAESVAARVHDNMRAGDFAVVYKESAPRIKTVATESEFVD